VEEGSGLSPEGAIWTPDRRVRVFVSSTLAELAPERAAARAAIEGLHLTPVLFELGARPHPPRALYAAYMDQSDVFIGIYWQRYGWVAPGATVSGLEDEYQLSSRLPRLLYVKEPAPDREAELARLLARFQTEGSVSYRRFTGPDELARLIADDLAVLLSERFGAAPSPGSSRLQRPAVPIPLTPTIGRRREIAAVAGLLCHGVRLVTITGTGGVGKSRLAVRVALEVVAEDRVEVYFISLTSVTDPRHLIATIAGHVGARLDTPAPVDALADHLRERPTLLVLDNFEHLATAAADLISLLDRCAALQLLVTSRHVLRVRGEHEFPLAPLDVPPPAATDIRKASAVKLFVDRAAAARPGFTLTAGNERPVAELCRRLDGLPLALELAAARLRLLEPGELLDRIGTRLDLLAGGAADLPERQRALRATLDWSYNLLTPAEQTLFARLSVFAGGATLLAAEAVCGGEELADVLEVMASLLEKSLLIHLAPAAGPARFQMLHVVRAYAWEHLADSGQIEELRARHAQWFLDAVLSREDAASGDDRWDNLDTEIDNIRPVLSWALEHSDLAAIATLARQLRPWWWARGMVVEALEWLERAAAMAAQLAPTSMETAWIALALGHLQQQAGRSDQADARLQAAIELFTSHDEADGAVTARLALASVLADRGRLREAITVAEEILRQGREAGRDDITQWAASILGTFLVAAGELDAARAAHEQAREAATHLGSGLYLALAHHQLAVTELLADRPQECWRHLGLAAEIYSRTPHLEGISYALEIAAAACLADHDVDRAADAAALAQQLHDTLRLPVWPVLRPLHDRLLAELDAATSGRKCQPATPASDPAALLRRICEHHLTSSA
jgi:predicted ATPase